MSNSQFEQIKQNQRQSWDSVALRWQKWWKIFENGAQTISDKLIETANIKKGSKILDIATGIGEPAITTAIMLVFTQDISSPVNAMLKNQSKERTEQKLNIITQKGSKHATTKDDNRDQKGPVSLSNESICIVGIK